MLCTQCAQAIVVFKRNACCYCAVARDALFDVACGSGEVKAAAQHKYHDFVTIAVLILVSALHGSGGRWALPQLFLCHSSSSSLPSFRRSILFPQVHHTLVTFVSTHTVTGVRLGGRHPINLGGDRLCGQHCINRRVLPVPSAAHVCTWCYQGPHMYARSRSGSGLCNWRIHPR